MSIEITSSGVVCCTCGKSYGRRKGYFPVSYSMLHKGVGHAPVCRACVDDIYNKYLAICSNPKSAVRQVCRKLDLYWSEVAFSSVEKKSSTYSIMTAYMSRISTTTYAGKSYDDTLLEEGTLWSWGKDVSDNTEEIQIPENTIEEYGDDEIVKAPLIPITEEIVEFWGTGYTEPMYAELEYRRACWMKKIPQQNELDVGTEAIIKQLCSLELDMNRDRAAGRSVDKYVTVYNNLLGSACLKPTQKRAEELDSGIANTPMGVWLYRFENKRPLPDIDEEFKDVNGIKRYILTWVKGHLAKMMGVKNSHSKMYEEEMERLRVEKPEFDDLDDEELLDKVLMDGDSDE